MTGVSETLLAAVERLPSVRVEIDDARRSAGVSVGARLIADIDLEQSRVLVHAPADTIQTLHGAFPSSRPAAHGIVFDLADAEHSAEALAAIRRRAHVETLVPQFREGSP